MFLVLLSHLWDFWGDAGLERFLEAIPSELRGSELVDLEGLSATCALGCVVAPADRSGLTRRGEFRRRGATVPLLGSAATCRCCEALHDSTGTATSARRRAHHVFGGGVWPRLLGEVHGDLGTSVAEVSAQTLWAPQVAGRGVARRIVARPPAFSIVGLLEVADRTA